VRIVSLLPSATEIVCALGLRDRLVGVTHGCDHPPDVAGLPIVSRTSIATDASSRAIDLEVRKRHAAGQPLYELDRELLAELAPDLLVTQGLCDVCAISEQVVQEAACALPGRPLVLSVAPGSLAEVFNNIVAIAEAAGVPERGRTLIAELEARVERVRHLAAGLDRRPRVTVLEWLDPLFAGGHWTPELVELAGGRDGHARPGERSRTLTWDEVRAWNPELLLVACCGFDLARTRAELGLLTSRPGWADLEAVRRGGVVLADGDAYFSRPGPRLVDSLDLLAHLVAPKAFPAPAVPIERLEPPGRW